VDTPILAVTDYGLVVASLVVLVVFLGIGWVIMQGTRAQLYWRDRAEQGDVEIITMLVTEEVNHWHTMRMPKGADPSAWRGLQSTELVEVKPDGFRLSATAEAQYAMVEGTRQQVSAPLREAMKVTAKVADMALYDIPNVRIPWVQVDVYSTFGDQTGSSQRCVLSTIARREVADDLDWDGSEPEEIVRAFGGRYLLDDGGHPLPIDPNGGEPTGVPAVFYND
jgi:hypothetical protein